jgi:hypothetical protein
MAPHLQIKFARLPGSRTGSTCKAFTLEDIFPTLQANWRAAVCLLGAHEPLPNPTARDLRIQDMARS